MVLRGDDRLDDLLETEPTTEIGLFHGPHDLSGRAVPRRGNSSFRIVGKGKGKGKGVERQASGVGRQASGGSADRPFSGALPPNAQRPSPNASPVRTPLA